MSKLITTHKELLILQEQKEKLKAIENDARLFEDIPLLEDVKQLQRSVDRALKRTQAELNRTIDRIGGYQ